jgi:TPR repeat protein
LFKVEQLIKRQGAAQDYAKAQDWYEKTAAAGEAAAMNNLGALYANGRGVAQDYAKAGEWYEKAAAAGNVRGMTNLGVPYEKGRGVAQDYAEARKWFEKAGAAGDATKKLPENQKYDSLLLRPRRCDEQKRRVTRQTSRRLPEILLRCFLLCDRKE